MANVKVEPNLAVGMIQEYVLLERGAILTFDGGRTTAADVGNPRSAFARFVASLDPNRCFIIALIPDDSDRDLYFAARDVASAAGMHMQAPVERVSQQRQVWDHYLVSKRSASAGEHSLPTP
jgi:hypothetical protein